MQQDLLKRLPPGELEEMAAATRDAVSFGQASQPSFTKAAVDALLTPGDTTADTFMRGALTMSQVPASVRLVAREMWLHKMAGGTVPKGLQDMVDLPHGTFVVAMTGILQAAAGGGARHQTLTAITGGLIQFGQSASSGMGKRFKRLFGRNGTSGELTG